MTVVSRRSGLRLSPRWGIVIFLACAAALNYADRSAFSAVLAQLRAELKLSDAGLGLVSSLFLWSYAVASPLAGYWADRYDRRKLVLLSLLSWSVVTALTALSRGIVSLSLLRLALGLAESVYLPAAIALIADYHATGTLGKALALHSVGLNLGVVAGGAMAGFFADRFDWRFSFGLLGMIGLLLFTAGLRTGRRGASAPPIPRRAASVRRALRYLSRTPTFYVLLLKTMLAGFTVWIFLSWLPLYFRDGFQLSLTASGFAGTFLLQFSCIAGIACGGWASDKAVAADPRGRLLLIAVSYLLAAPFLLLFLRNPGFAGAAVAVASFSFLRGIGEAGEKPALCDVVPEPFRSSALGVMNTCATAAGGLGVLLTGLIKSRLGLNAVFAGCAATLGFASLCVLVGGCLFVRRDSERAARYSPPPSPDFPFPSLIPNPSLPCK